MCIKNIVAIHSTRFTPHFGGLWEAAIKSTKKHPIIGNAHLTFEKL